MERRPRYKRAKNPPSMRFQARDGQILQSIQDFDGVLARRHIKEIYWSDQSEQVMQVRLSKLYHNGFIDWPSLYQRSINPIPEPIIWLGWRGILYLAGINGLTIGYPSKLNENQLRGLQKRLRENNLRWLREPNWSHLNHDISLADFRLAIIKSLKNHPKLNLERWIPESYFRSNPDRVVFTYKGNNGKTYKRKKGVIPDSMVVFLNSERFSQKKPARVRFLIELDMATHSTPNFGIEKAAAGRAYIRSVRYKERFSANSGRWLIITTSMRRKKNLIEQTMSKTAEDASLFFFTTNDQIHKKDILRDPIWSHPGNDNLISLPIL